MARRAKHKAASQSSLPPTRELLPGYAAITQGPAPLMHKVYQRFLAHYGPQGWWPADTPFEVAIGAILTQSTAWTNVARAIANLKAAGSLDPFVLHRMPDAELAGLIRPSGYFNAKARKVKAFVAVLVEEFEGEMARLVALPTATLRERLLTIYGIGPETADSIALYAGGHPLFVVDAYTRRLAVRLGLAEPNVSYDDLQAIFTANLPVDVALYNEFHALIVAHGKDTCRTKPRCEGCPVADLCKESNQFSLVDKQ